MTSVSLWVQVVYIIASVLILLGIKRLGSPVTARSGNRLGAVGVALAVIATVIDAEGLNLPLIALAVVIGALIGLLYASGCP